MRKKWILILTIILFTVAFYLACDTSGNPLSSDGDDDEKGITINQQDFVNTIAEALAENNSPHDEAPDYNWNGQGAEIILNGTTATSAGSGVTINGSTITINAAGTYILSGTLTDGQIIVDTADIMLVRLVLNGVDISNSTSAAIYIINAQKTIIVLADNSTNSIKDGANYVFGSADGDEPNAAIFSNDNLTITGGGSLSVEGNYNDAISSKDGLVIYNANITVDAADDGIRGKEYLIINGNRMNVKARGDGLKSDDDTAKNGYVYIKGGSMVINAGGDAISATTDVLIGGGAMTITTGGGSSKTVSADASAKGIKSVVNSIIEGGSLSINSADDALHSNGNLVINDGTFILSSGDDGIHADSCLVVNGGDITITKCYEGLESRAIIMINDGTLHIVASDDGLNVAGGMDSSGWPGGQPPGPPGPGGQGGFSETGDYYLYINGGRTVIEAVGDGIDVNGKIFMTGGEVLVHGPTADMNGALDYDSAFKITGGLLIAAGSSGMAQIPGTSSTQNSVLINFNATHPAGSILHIQNANGDELLTFSPKKKYRSMAFSSPLLQKDTTYELYVGGSSTGAENDGLYKNGTYTPGTQYNSFSLSGVATRINR